jgi:hypothetical protein
MALRYLDKLSEQQQGLREQQQKAGGWAAGWRGKAGAAAGSVAVLKPEFLIFRNITSAVVAQVSNGSSCGGGLCGGMDRMSITSLA